MSSSASLRSCGSIRLPMLPFLVAILIAIPTSLFAEAAKSGTAADSSSRRDSASSQWPVCTGFNPETGRFGLVGAWQNAGDGLCPKGYAYVGLELQSGTPRPLAQMATFGDCCPLPEGALLDEHVYVISRCPDGFVATGGTTDSAEMKRYLDETDEKAWWTLHHQMRCTRVNSMRFTLGPPQSGWRLGWGRDPSLGTLLLSMKDTESMTARARLPEGLRYGVGRMSASEWAQDHCIGHPFGALLVERVRGRECSGLIYRELIDRSSGAPSRPTCSAIDNPLRPDAVCIDSSPANPSAPQAPAADDEGAAAPIP